MKNNVSIHSSFSATWAIAHLSSESQKLESSIKQVNQNNWLKKINLEVCRGKKNNWASALEQGSSCRIVISKKLLTWLDLP